jgi:hypothetical protein
VLLVAGLAVVAWMVRAVVRGRGEVETARAKAA